MDLVLKKKKVGPFRCKVRNGRENVGTFASLIDAEEHYVFGSYGQNIYIYIPVINNYQNVMEKRAQDSTHVLHTRCVCSCSHSFAVFCSICTPDCLRLVMMLVLCAARFQGFYFSSSRFFGTW